MGRDFSGGAVDFGVLAADFELEDVVGLVPGRDVGVGQESYEAFLKSSEAALDLALGLGSWGDQVRNPKSK